METTLAANTGNVLLTPEDKHEMRNNFTIKVHIFKGMNQAQRIQQFAQVKSAWDQFTEVCHQEIEPTHIAKFAKAMQGQGHDELRCDYMIVISSKKYVLGYALAAEEKIRYDDPTLNILSQPAHSHAFDSDKTLHIKLLCARDGSGMGKQLIRVCENLAIHTRCASVHLEAVPTAYGFYKSIGLSPFRDVKVACSPGYINSDAETFERAILAMARSFEGTEGTADTLSSARLRQRYKAYMNRASEPRRAVLSGVLVSRIVEPSRVHKWTTQKSKLDKELNHIVDTVFTKNNVHSETIPMTKCLIKTSTEPQEEKSDSDSIHSGDTIIDDPGCAIQANSAQGSESSDSPEYLRTVHDLVSSEDSNSDAQSDMSLDPF